jgi:phosphoribosylglycinamide formyltransferase-1
MRLGIIGSSGGSALAAAAICLQSLESQIDWLVIVDRDCGLKSWAQSNNQQCHKIEYLSPERFSKEACSIFQDYSCEHVLLFFTRRVSLPLIDTQEVVNIHPSLLPSFRGLHGLRDSYRFGSRIFGSTLHRVNHSLDDGDVLCQVAEALPMNATFDEICHRSYVHKVWLTLAWVDQLISLGKGRNFEITPNGEFISCPGLASDKLRSEFLRFAEQ